MKIRIVRISNGDVRTGEYKGLATSKGSQFLVKMGSLLTYYKFNSKTGLGLAGARGFTVIGEDFNRVRDEIHKAVRGHTVAEQLRK